MLQGTTPLWQRSEPKVASNRRYAPFDTTGDWTPAPQLSEARRHGAHNYSTSPVKESAYQYRSYATLASATLLWLARTSISNLHLHRYTSAHSPGTPPFESNSDDDRAGGGPGVWGPLCGREPLHEHASVRCLSFERESLQSALPSGQRARSPLVWAVGGGVEGTSERTGGMPSIPFRSPRVTTPAFHAAGSITARPIAALSPASSAPSTASKGICWSRVTEVPSSSFSRRPAPPATSQASRTSPSTCPRAPSS